MKNLTRVALLAVVVSSLAFAEDEAPPPESGGSGMRRSGFLLDASSHERPMLLGIHAILPYGHYYGGFGIGAGASFYIPLVKDGFIPPVNDEFGIDFGADATIFFYYAPFSLTIPVCALWTFHITDKFAAYAKVGIALKIHPGWISPVFPDWVSVVGINYMFSSSFGLRAEAGYPGFKAGILFAF
ncbi:MAG: hypothetical protein Q8L48_00795 [Archangium sp.]|nr:hypothetical protein [Archangium sp.]